MAKKPRPARRVNVKGRSEGSGHHARFYAWEIRSPAYRSLSIGARALLIELKALYFGNNNGTLFLSVREAAIRLNCSKNLAAKLFIELQDRGFLRPNVVGAFNLKTESRRGNATSWILTEFSIGDAKGVGTKDFMHWRPPIKKHSTVPVEVQSVPPTGTVPFKLRQTVPSTVTVLAEIDDRRSLLEVHR